MVIMILVNSSGFEPYKVSEAVAPNPNVVVDFDYMLQRFLGSLLPNAGFTSLGALIEVAMALAPILIIFFVYELIYIRLSFKKVLTLLNGFVATFIGLSIFLTAVGSTMSPIGLKVGQQMATNLLNGQEWVIIIIAFVIGCVTILCEPAVHVLTTQIEDISDGQLKKKTVLIALSVGVGVAICLSVIRTIFEFSIMYYIIPGYMISLVLMFAVPDLYTAIAFDSGGTASGPMAVSFVLPLIIGIFNVKRGLGYEGSVEYYEFSFGVVSMVALTPIIAIQVLGLATKFKSLYALHVIREQIHDERNNEIIHFN